MNEKLCPKCNQVVIPKSNFFGLERCPECKTSLDHVAWISAQSEAKTTSVANPPPLSGKSRGRLWGFDPITSRDGALKTIKEAAIGLLVLAGIQTVIFAFVMRSGLIDTFLLAVLALLLLWLKSRIIAILVLVYSIVEGFATLLSFAGVENLGGKNIWLAALIVWTAIKAVDATFKLHGKYAEPDVIAKAASVPTIDNPKDSRDLQ